MIHLGFWQGVHPMHMVLTYTNFILESSLFGFSSVNRYTVKRTEAESMQKRILMIPSSLRTGSNSTALAEAFARGAIEAGHEVEWFSLKGKTIGFCTGCLACQRKQKCVQSDSMQEALDKLRRADVVVFAAPVYFYGLPGQLKTFLDRTEPLYQVQLPFDSLYLLASAAEQEDWVFERSEEGIRGWMDCFPEQRLELQVLRTGGLSERGSIQPDSPYWKRAYAMGNAVCGLEGGMR